MAEPIYVAQDSPPHVVSPMEEYACLRARHEGLMKQHAHLRDEVVGHLRESIARLESECEEMAGVRNFLNGLHPNTENRPEYDQIAAMAEQVQRQIETAQRRGYPFGR